MYDRDALLAATDLRALADELVGPAGRGDRSRMWHCPNPQHAQTGRTPPVSIFTSRRGEQRWRCHGCGEGGTAIDLVIACQGSTARDAMTYLAGRVGHREPPDTWRPTRRAIRPQPAPQGCSDPAGLDRYVDDCAERLWTPEGSALRRWLTNARGLPEQVLARNRVGADLGKRAQPRPNGMPKVGGIVLPAMEDGHAVYAQIRVPHPWPDGPKYLFPRSDLATNPRLSRIRPVEARHPEVIVTEGVMDALSAAAAGYRSVAVLAAGYGDEAVALALAKVPHPLVVAFDADEPGRLGAGRLATLLETRQRPPVVVNLGQGDLNDAMRRSGDDWPRQMSATIAHARATAPRTGLGVGISR